MGSWRQKLTSSLRSDFLKNTIWLTSGTTIAQLISFGTAPFLTRIYDPSDYGLLGVYMIFCSLISVVATLQYSNGVVIAQSDEEASGALRLCWYLNAGVAILLLITVLVFKSAISSFYKNPSLSFWLLAAPVSVFFVGINTIFSAWAVRKRQFKLLARNKIYTALLAPVFSIMIGVITADPMGLFAGLLVSQLLPTIRMLYFFWKTDKIDLGFNAEEIKVIARKFRNFPKFSMPAEFINSFSNQIPVLIIGRVGNPQVVGWYNHSVRMLGLPSSLIATSIGDVFRQRAAKDYFEKGSCRPIFMKVAGTLFLLSLVPFLILLFFGPALFAWVFGEQWREAGVMSQILGILYLFRFVASPLSYVTYIANKQWVGLVLDILLLSVLGAIWYFSISLSLTHNQSLMFFSVGYSACYILTFFLSYKFTVNKDLIKPVPSTES